MRKGLVIIFAVAILGALGIFINKDKSSSGIASDANSTSQTSSAGTSAQAVSSNSTGTAQNGSYKDGTYTKSADTPYGTVKISVVISGGRIGNILFEDMPNGEDRSAEITAFSSAPLKQSAIDAQSASIDFVSGATSTSYGFQESLQAALDAAAQSG